MGPRDAGFWAPAEWAPHDATWLAFPYRREEWGAALEPARREQAALIRAVLDPDPRTGAIRGEAVELLVADAGVERAARRLLEPLPVSYRRLPYGDSWTRDTGPVLLTDPAGRLGAVRFAFDGWGGRFHIPGDAELAGRIVDTLGVPSWNVSWVIEGGALEVDGQGTCLTTRTCLLDGHRNPGADERGLEATLGQTLGVERVLWLEGALRGDHTDGHVDTLARFVAPGVVVFMEPRSREDPNRDTLGDVRRQLGEARDATGRRLELHPLPSPGPVTDEDGEVLPASYCNFYVANGTVVVPVYDRPSDDEAVARIAELFPDRPTIGLRARATLRGGGAFHCITREQPRSGAGPAADIVAG